MRGHPGSDKLHKELTEPICSACGGRDDLRLIEQRIRWGAAVRRGIGTGFTGRPIWWCVSCRRRRGSHSFKYHRPEK